MGDIALVAGEIAAVHPRLCEMYNVEAGEAITKGMIVCWDTDGQVIAADGNQAARDEPIGCALRAGAAGETVSILVKGLCEGFTVSGLNTGVLLTLSDTNTGILEDAGAGEHCGRVWAAAGGETVDYLVFFDFDVAAASV